MSAVKWTFQTAPAGEVIVRATGSVKVTTTRPLPTHSNARILAAGKAHGVGAATTNSANLAPFGQHSAAPPPFMRKYYNWHAEEPPKAARREPSQIARPEPPLAPRNGSATLSDRCTPAARMPPQAPIHKPAHSPRISESSRLLYVALARNQVRFARLSRAQKYKNSECFTVGMIDGAWRVSCGCGATVDRGSFGRHTLSGKHLDWLECH